MGDNYEENYDNRSRACKLLGELKKIEKKTKFHTKRLSPTTVVMCKNEDRLKQFEEQY